MSNWGNSFFGNSYFRGHYQTDKILLDLLRYRGTLSDVGLLGKIPQHSVKTQSPKQSKLNYKGSPVLLTQNTQINRWDLGLGPPVPSYKQRGH